MLGCRGYHSIVVDFSGVLPLFPLPNGVLFPGQLMPLHIFEPRYRQMVADARAGEPYIGMVLWRPDRTPDIPSIACMGVIAHHVPMADGRSNILLRGLSRVRIDEELDGKPYRRARVTLVSSEEPPAAFSKDIVDDLVSILGPIIERARAPLDLEAEAKKGAGALADFIAGISDLDAEMRQSLLEEPNGLQRARRLLEALHASAAGPARVRRPPEMMN
ncbi:MAG: hypothetical protein A3F84_15850 [Candidatus Handelsmanbacteria bacterium RIFCSPLOWO2_12_FULL_64_10]|uniref:Lon N-terminal domain-containing protein n=1 Tax=Handelsmanbacteria sp. (strain RIFCSPLOWO2_12_FULL_64_10) TaxID=1817868 RepID=A0A1F6D3U6_HANXR|nr:MAG: hypothetical protein A3F84_15850 [Candidatus Handelsmanbacteria bacterium RIFCSPLOWO2_12_FULL_64_10]